MKASTAQLLVGESLKCSDGTSCNVSHDVIIGYRDDISNAPVDSVADCCANCNSNSRCTAWTVEGAKGGSPNGMTCWLHAGTTTHAQTGSISALRNTPLPPPSKDGWYPCANANASNYKFCDTSLSIDDRLADLVPRIDTSDAGSQLTARESPSISTISLPSYYWGTCLPNSPVLNYL